MLELTDALIIGKGTERTCYIHPENALLCIKINHSQRNKQSQKEIAYCELLKKQGRLPCKSIPQFYGTVLTNLGQGSVFDRVKNYNNEASLSLAEALPLLTEKNDETSLSKILTALGELKQDLLNHCILVRDLTLKNIYIQNFDEEKLNLVLVDGFGNSDFIPIASYLKSYATLKIKRRWRRLEQKFLEAYPENNTIKTILGSSQKTWIN